MMKHRQGSEEGLVIFDEGLCANVSCGRDGSFVTPPPKAVQSNPISMVCRVWSNGIRSKSRGAILPKLLAFLRSVFTRPDLDYATFQRLESKRTPQEMRKNGLY